MSRIAYHLLAGVGAGAFLFGGIAIAPASDAVSFSESTTELLPGDAAAPFFSGVAIGVVDMNGDGKDDIVRFDDGEDLHIEYQTASGNVFDNYVGRRFSNIRVAVAVADYDGNGMRDLTCGGYSGGTHLLTANAAGTDFALATLPDTDIVMQGMNFVDLDGDGDVDVFACDDVDDNHKYRNNGSGALVLDHALIGTFIPAQPGQLSPNAGNYASLWTDYDNDGDLDMYLSKCRQGENRATQLSRINRLFRREADGTFAEVAAAAGLDSGAQTWCADFADVDNDGDLDVFMVNHVMVGSDEPSAFYRNNGNGTFAEATIGSGISTPFFGVQTIFRDFNNDGFVDLLVSSTGNGYRLFLNDGDGSFTSQPAVFTTIQTGSGSPIGHIHSFGVGDLNSDGWLDIYVGRAFGLNSPGGERDRLYLNDGGTNHFLQVRLVGGASNPDGIGARLELHGAWGVQLREVRSGEGYGVMHSLTQHFGLGESTAIDKLVVRWPSGTIDVIDNPTADNVLAVSEGASPPAFGEWQSLVFSDAELLDPTISGPNANPDGDLLVNLFEWYFRMRPKDLRSTRSPIADFSVEEVAPGDRRGVVTIHRQRIPGLTETAEISHDLITWSRGSPHVEIVADTAEQLVLRSAAGGFGFKAIRFVLEAQE